MVILTVLYKQQHSWQLHKRLSYNTASKKCLCFLIQVFKAGQEMTGYSALRP